MPNHPLVTGRTSRRDLLRYAGLLATAAGIGSAVSACKSGPSADTAAGSSEPGTITAVVGYGNNQSWDPTQTASAFSMAAINHCYEALVEGDPVSRRSYPALAKALPATANAGRFRFQLRDGATWHDGQPVTADDVAFTYARILSPKDNVLIRSFFSLWLKRVDVVDDRTVEFVLNFPFPYALERIQIAKIMPRHVFDGKWDDAKAGKVVGSGPYRMVEHVPSSHTSFAKYPGYNGPRPAGFEKMTWRSVVDAPTRVAAISGKHPAAVVADNIPADQVEGLRKAGREVEQVDGMNNIYLLFNTQRKPFDDKRVRQALHYAVDGRKLVEVALKGAGIAANSYINPKLTATQQALAIDFAYDPQKARQLLADAGAGNLTIELLATTNSLVAECVKLVKEMWAQVGVHTTVNAMDTAPLFAKLDTGADFQVVTGSGNPQQFGVDVDLLIRDRYSPDSLWTTKYARWNTPEAAELYGLLDTAAKETDPAKRAALQKQLLDQLADQAVIYPMVFTALGTAWDPTRITGVRPLGYPGVSLLQAD